MAVKTDKQVVSGFHRPVCKRCKCELRPETNGVGVLDLAEDGRQIEIFDADLWKCPKCGFEVVGGFGHGPVSGHWEPDFQSVVANYKKHGLLIENNG